MYPYISSKVIPETVNTLSTKLSSQRSSLVNEQSNTKVKPTLYSKQKKHNDDADREIENKVEYLNILRGLKSKIKNRLQRSIENAQNEIDEGKEALQTLQTLNKAYQGNQNQEREMRKYEFNLNTNSTNLQGQV